MSNLYRLDASTTELARQFGVDPAPDVRVPSPVRPGEQGLIVRGVSGDRSMRVLKWGFPRPGRDVEPATVNLVADLTNFMWDGMVPDPRYRCLVPVTAFGQPDGPKGFKTRTWFTIRMAGVRARRFLPHHAGMGPCLCSHDGRQQRAGQALHQFELAAEVSVLDGRAGHVSIGAIDATVSGLGLQDGAAALAVVEILAGIGRHLFGFGVAAERAGDRRFQDDGGDDRVSRHYVASMLYFGPRSKEWRLPKGHVEPRLCGRCGHLGRLRLALQSQLGRALHLDQLVGERPGSRPRGRVRLAKLPRLAGRGSGLADCRQRSHPKRNARAIDCRAATATRPMLASANTRDMVLPLILPPSTRR